VSGGWCLCRAAKTDGEKKTTTASEEAKEETGVDIATYKSSVEQVKAIAAKISAARRLARKLAEEKAAVAALSDGDSREAELYDLPPLKQTSSFAIP
jgi:predicted NUDIX family NTP pyrophosphohydrolase